METIVLFKAKIQYKYDNLQHSSVDYHVFLKEVALGEIVWLFQVYSIFTQRWTQIIQSQRVFLVLQ